MKALLSSFANRAVLVVGGGLMVAALLAHTTFFDRLNWWFEDAQQRLLARPLEFRNTLTVDVDEASMALLEPELGPWPYARDIYARAARFLLANGAKAVVFDILFAESRRGDRELAREIGPKVVLAAAALPMGLARSAEYHARLEALSTPAQPASPAREWSDLTLPLAQFTLTGAKVGVISFAPDSDGTFRRASLLHLAYGRVIPGLALAAVAAAGGGSVLREENTVRSGSTAWPVNARGEAALRFPASMAPMEIVPFHAMVQAIEGAAATREIVDLVRGRIVFIGSSSAVLGDFVYTPVGRLPGLHATALSAELLLEGRVMRPPRPPLDIALLFVALAIPLVMIGRESTLRPLGFLALIVVSVLATAALGVVLNAFGQQSHWVFASLTAFTSGLLALVAWVFSLHRERQRLYYEAEAANAANRMKTDFLNRMTHELRTPITAISGFNKINHFTDNLGKEARISNSEVIARNCDHLLALINDNLDIARIEAGALGIERKAERVIPIFEGAAATFRQLALEKGVALKFIRHGDIPKALMLDPLRTRQVLINLLGNAIKFTDAGAVVLEVSWRKGMLEFSVKDSAGGIPSEIQQRLFAPFQRVVGSRKPGTGLGLAITKNLVDLMSGSIEVESTPGVGAEFRVRLPAESAEQEVASSDAPAPAAAGRLGGRVLVAEDNGDIRYLLSAHLDRLGVQYKMEHDGFAAVQAALGGGFDLVLMDLEMPVMDGFEAAHVLRENGYTGPIVAMTSHVEGPATERARNEGCDAVTAKPLRGDQMESLLHKYLNFAPAGEPAPLEREKEVLTAKYLEQCRRDVATLRQGLAAGKFETISGIAHRLRGAGGFYGFDEITQLGLEVETAASAKQTSRNAELVERLSEFVEKSASGRRLPGA